MLIGKKLVKWLNLNDLFSIVDQDKNPEFFALSIRIQIWNLILKNLISNVKLRHLAIKK